MPTPIPCPICGRQTDFFTDPVGPFCSARCKQIDLGNWLGETYRISEPLSPEHLEGYETMEGSALDQPDGDDL